MTDLEKVIKGLECCTSLRSVGETCKKCPYDIPQTTACYRGQLLEDALALMKEQNPVPPNWMQNENGIWNTCKRCGYILKPAILDKEPEKQKMFFYFPKFCSECGQAVEWE